MKEFKGSNGPWCVDFHNVDARWNIDDEGGDSVALTNQVVNDKDFVKRDANTKLIAAAPELLEALTLALPHIMESAKKDGHAFAVYNMANRIICKALGE